MKGINFKEANALFKGAPGSGVTDLAVFRDGSKIISCWEISDAELEIIKQTKKVYLGILGQAMPPVMILAESPFVQFKNPFAYCHVKYKKPTRVINGHEVENFKRVFVRGDIAIPSTFVHEGEVWYLVTKIEESTPVPDHNIAKGEWFFVLIEGALKIHYLSSFMEGEFVEVPMSLK